MTAECRKANAMASKLLLTSTFSMLRPKALGLRTGSKAEAESNASSSSAASE